MSEEVVKTEGAQAAPAQPAPSSPNEPPPVPYSRFSEIIKERNALQERAARADTLATALQEAQAKITQTEAQFTTFRTVASTLGQTDPEAIELVQYAYGRLPAEGRPELATWLGAVKADPGTAPLAIKHLLSPLPASQAPAPVQAPGAPRPQPAASPAGTPATNPTPSDADIARVREACVRSGDWTAWKEMKKNLPK